MRWGLLGVEHVHAAYYAWILARSHDMELLGVSDDDATLARSWADEHGAVAFATHEELLEQVPDAVAICSPTAHHLRLIRLAAGAGTATSSASVRMPESCWGRRSRCDRRFP